MAIGMSDSEIQAFVEQQHTGILVTQEREGPGMPVPVWFWAAGDGHIYVSSPPSAAKVRRVRERPQVRFLVEAGKAWKDLRAVVFDGTATVHEDGPVHERAITELNERYAEYRVSPEELPGVTQKKYGVRSIIAIRIDRVRTSWDNSKIRLREPQ